MTARQMSRNDVDVRRSLFAGQNTIADTALPANHDCSYLVYTRARSHHAANLIGPGQKDMTRDTDTNDTKHILFLLMVQLLVHYLCLVAPLRFYCANVCSVCLFDVSEK